MRDDTDFTAGCELTNSGYPSLLWMYYVTETQTQTHLYNEN